MAGKQKFIDVDILALCSKPNHKSCTDLQETLLDIGNIYESYTIDSFEQEFCVMGKAKIHLNKIKDFRKAIYKLKTKSNVTVKDVFIA